MGPTAGYRCRNESVRQPEQVWGRGAYSSKGLSVFLQEDWHLGCSVPVPGGGQMWSLGIQSRLVGEGELEKVGRETKVD